MEDQTEDIWDKRYRIFIGFVLFLWFITPLLNLYGPVLSFEGQVLSGITLILIKLYILKDRKNESSK